MLRLQHIEVSMTESLEKKKKVKSKSKPMVYCDGCGRLTTHPLTAAPVAHKCH